MENLLRKLSQENLLRAATFDRAAVDKEARTVEIAFSSEEPYRRWYGTEILGHEKGEIEMEFLTSGRAPLLAGHDHYDQIGVIEKAWIDADRKGRAIVRFGKSARAEEYFQDVLDGIRSNVSVGYRVHEMKMVKKDDKAGDTYRVTKWTPLEASLVAVPADKTVGVGREDTEQPKIEVKSMEPKEKEKTVDIESIKVEARNAETARIKDITAIGKMHKLDAMAAKAIADDKTLDQFRAMVLDELDKRGQKPVDIPDPSIGLSEKEVRAFSFMKLVRALCTNDWTKAGFERECSQAFEDKTGRQAKGAFIPHEVMIDQRFAQIDMRLLQGLIQRGLTTNVGTQGGYLVGEQLLTGSFIDLLRNASSIMQMGVRMLTGLVGDIDIPKQTGGATAYWVNEGGDLTGSQQALNQIRMSPKSLGCYTDITRRMMLQSSIDVENFVRGDFAIQMALAMDLAGLNGTGGNGQPLGILNTTGIGSVTLNAAHTPTWANIVGLETEVSTDNALMGSLGYITNATIAGNMKVTEKATGTAKFLLEDGQTNGYRCLVSNNVPTKHIVFGNFADLIIALWSGLDVTVDTNTLSKSGGTRIVCFQDCDVAVRHAESFADGYKA
jgi:HK97 family phage major capsid protein